MLTGPTAIAGQAGVSDGRLDLLLDVGTYKLRLTGSPHTTGTVALSVTPFLDAAPPAGAPIRGTLDASLDDTQQRRYWLRVSDDTPIRLEAAGRALGDLRLFRDGRELVPLDPVHRVTEPVAGHSMTDLVLAGKLEPGTYALVAFGAPPRPWTDGAPATPFHLRSGASDALDSGFVAGRIGPFGSEIFSAGPAVGALRLDLPEPAAVTLSATVGDRTTRTSIERRSRAPLARLFHATGAASLVEVAGVEGQPFQLRAQSGTDTRASVGDGPYWMSIDATGLGGDEPPLTYVLTTRQGRDQPTVRASDTPQVGPGSAWRRRFNLRGAVSLAFNVTAPGPIAVRTGGVAVQADVGAFGGAFRARANGSSPGAWDLAAGFYVLRLVPARDGQGIVDVQIGPPGITAEVPPIAPTTADSALPIGLTTLSGQGTLEVFGTNAPGTMIGLLERPAPVALSDGPLVVTLAANAALDVPVRLPPDGTLVATEIGRAPVAMRFVPAAGLMAGAHRHGACHAGRPPPYRRPGLAASPADAHRDPAGGTAAEPAAARGRRHTIFRSCPRHHPVVRADRAVWRAAARGNAGAAAHHREPRQQFRPRSGQRRRQRRWPEHAGAAFPARRPLPASPWARPIPMAISA